MGAYRSSSNNSNNGIFVGSIILFFIFGFVLLVIYSYFKEKKRRKEIKDYCLKNNIEYSESITSSDLPQKARDFKTINRGKKGEIGVAMKTERDGLNITIFDYTFFTEKEVFTTGKHGQQYSSNETYVHYETVCLIKKSDIIFPKFFLKDKSELSNPHTSFSNFGKQFIKVDGDSSFSQNFILHGFPEENVKTFFNQNIMKVFKNNHVEGYKYEGNNDCLMISIASVLDLKGRLDLLKNSLNVFNEIVSNIQ